MAWHLALAFEQAGHQICEIFSREEAKALKLCASLYAAEAKTDLDFDESEAKLFVLAVSDDAMADVCSQLVLPQDSIIAHTSGSKSLEDLQRLMLMHHDLPVQVGVIYPLMTFSINTKMDLREVPFCIESQAEDAEQILVKLAQQISQTVYLVDSEERKILHVAAVFACNFTNHLLALAKEMVEEENLEFDLLKPLIHETFRKAMAAEHPANVQTGPAVRGDELTIARHLEYLLPNKDLSKIYQIMTESIQKWHE